MFNLACMYHQLRVDAAEAFDAYAQDCNSTSGALVQQLLSVNFTQPPYSTAYPAIVDSLAFHPCVPVRANVTSNTYEPCSSIDRASVIFMVS